MIWHYRCPNCEQPLEVEWELHRDEAACPKCREVHYPVTPQEDHFAYFGGEKWPQEMVDAVVAVRGTTCSVPGCFQPFSILSHRRPVSRGGRTSVDNLVPMCAQHARLKGDRDFDEWLRDQASFPPQQPVKPVEITITRRDRRPPPGPEPRLVGYVQPVAGLVRPPALPSSLRLIAAAPFLPGPARKLLLEYDWQLEADGRSRVILMAWPHNQPPKHHDARGIPVCAQAASEHSGKAGDSDTGYLELALAGAGRWLAVLAVEDSSARLAITDYLLSLTD